MVNTLTRICQGGIYDHLGGGFARYSVDQRWLAPHFEKMLYDNAQLLELMTLAWLETRAPLLRVFVSRKPSVGCLREMIAESGAFAASLDADSAKASRANSTSGRNRKSTRCSMPTRATLDVLSPRLRRASARGNWEETNILNRLHSLDILDDATERHAHLGAPRAL